MNRVKSCSGTSVGGSNSLHLLKDHRWRKSHRLGIRHPSCGKPGATLARGLMPMRVPLSYEAPCDDRASRAVIAMLLPHELVIRARFSGIPIRETFRNHIFRLQVPVGTS